jgi:predicted Zn-ribbon and HTH transcriptional regulator
MPEIIESVKKYKCADCGYVWEPVVTHLPKKCPNCQSKEWNKEKIGQNTRNSNIP